MKDIVEKTALLEDTTYLIYAPTGESYTYRESNLAANRIAHSLNSIGLRKGDRVGIFMTNTPDYVFIFYASAKLGLIEVPFNTNFRAPEISYMVNNADISTIIVEANQKFIEILCNVAKQSPGLKNIIVVGEIGSVPQTSLNFYSLSELIKTGDDSNPEVSVDGEDDFSIIFTSGTTGLPKGAITKNKTAVLGAMSIGAMAVTQASRMYTCLPFFHTNAQIFTALGMRLLGASMVLDERFSPRKLWHEITKYQADCFSSLGGMIQILDSVFAEDEVPEHPARMVWVAGTPAALWERFEKKFKVEVYEGYGMTEAPVAFVNCHPDKTKRKTGSVGKPLFGDLGRQVKLVNDQNEASLEGLGEVVQKGRDFITRGYWNAPQANQEAFDQDGWFHTGDVLRVDKEGYYYFVDRNKFMIRVGGENVSAFEVEDVINSHPVIAQSAAIPVPDPFKGEEIKVLLKLAENAADQVDFRELVGHCARKLAYFKVPRYFEIIDEFPKTATERIQKTQLKEREKQQQDHGWDRNEEFSEWRSVCIKAHKKAGDKNE
ncbi:MAG: AMP-binding protein [Thermincola sp.]|nr:AMP-binding protein [Thermincola sp.]